MTDLWSLTNELPIDERVRWMSSLSVDEVFTWVDSLPADEQARFYADLEAMRDGR